jgi:hypothetical protein
VPRNVAYRLPQPLFDEPTFSQGTPTPDPTRFKVPHPSDAELYKRIQALLYEDVVPFPAARGTAADLYELATALGPHGPEQIASVTGAGRIVFHMVGDIGASTSAKYPGELRVSDQITNDIRTSAPADRPQFLYLLGDLVYDFGEAQYYYDQFYEPYRDYPAPIFAIPGNHDSFVVPGTLPAQAPLATFQRNFCAAEPVVTPEAGSLHRTAMTQPGVYFTLDAPFVRIVGLFSNALEDPGVISSEDGKWATIPEYQLDFLTAQLARVTSDGFTGALLLAVHHPPFCYEPPAGAPGAGGIHQGSPTVLAEIDTICAAAGVYPHAFISGHAHNYQRFTRSVRFGSAAYQVPFLVCGGGGHDVTSLVRAQGGATPTEPTDGLDVSYLDVDPAVPATGLVLDRHDDRTYGYLRVAVDAEQLRLDFFQVGAGAAPSQPADSVTVSLGAHTIVASAGAPSPATRPAGRKAPRLLRRRG